MTDTDKKRQAILASDAYRSGRTFLTCEMTALMRKAVGRPLKPKEDSQTLNEMRRYGLLESFQSDKGANNWHRPRSKQTSVPWRTQSNAALGIIEQAGPVEWARHGA